MRSRDARVVTAAVAAALAAFACAGCAPASTAPPGMLPTVHRLATDPYGAWVTVTWRAQEKRTVSGELISITPDLVLVLSDTTWTEIPTARIQQVAAEPWKGERETVAPYSRLSRSVSSSDLKRIARYARFPGGMPPEVDRATLRSRPATTPAHGR